MRPPSRSGSVLAMQAPCSWLAEDEVFVLVVLRKEKLEMLPASYLWIHNLRKRFIYMNVSKGMSAPTRTPTGTRCTRT